jgi:hypothetical protein
VSASRENFDDLPDLTDNSDSEFEDDFQNIDGNLQVFMIQGTQNDFDSQQVFDHPDIMASSEGFSAQKSRNFHRLSLILRKVVANLAAHATQTVEQLALNENRRAFVENKARNVRIASRCLRGLAQIVSPFPLLTNSCQARKKIRDYL